jgi:hypothetical protein
MDGAALASILHVAGHPSSSHCCCPIIVVQLLSPLLLPYYIDESIIVVTMAAGADRVLLFPQPMEHVVHHHCCRQPQRPQSGIGHSSLPSQHKADCYVKRGQIVGNLLIGSSLLLLCHSSVTPPTLVCRPLRFAEYLSQSLHLLLHYCAPLVQLVVIMPCAFFFTKKIVLKKILIQSEGGLNH